MTIQKYLWPLHVVMFSGGIGSWAAAKRVVQSHGTNGVVLLFADTLMEDCDLYRFLNEASENIGIPITKVCDGRTPWDVFRDVSFLGNSRVDPCSRVLKRELLNKWRDIHCDPAVTTIHLGIDWSEIHRLHGARERAPQWKIEAPMCEKPCMTKEGMLQWAEKEGIRRPRLYEMGFPHNNCGGFCIKAGHSQFELLLKTMPDRFAFHEHNESEIRKTLGDVAILRSRKGGVSRPLTLQELRETVQSKRVNLLFDDEDWGGCGCALDDGVMTGDVDE